MAASSPAAGPRNHHGKTGNEKREFICKSSLALSTSLRAETFLRIILQAHEPGSLGSFEHTRRAMRVYVLHIELINTKI